MGEILPGNFGKKPEQEPVSPFKRSEVTENSFNGESSFSPNKIVEYRSGVKPRNDERVNEKVIVHVKPMEKTIYSIAPKLKDSRTSEDMAELVAQLSYTQLVDAIADSTIQEWTKEPKWYLALIQEVRIRGLDIDN